ncbi:MAG TPA: cyclic nucleotide-binding domain-containing protein [Candidatus Eisenbacteria bacterium]
MDSGFFPGLSTEDLARVAGRTTEVHVEAGQLIDYDRGIHLLIEGKVEVTLNDRVIRNIAPGDGIGLASVLGIEEHEGFAARAAEHSHLLSMCRDDFQDVLTEFPEVAILLLKENMRQLLGLFRRIQELTGERPDDMPA